MKMPVLLSFVLIISMLLAGCGAEPEAAPAALTPVTLQLQWVTQSQFAGYYVALEKGWYKEEGIDLSIIPGGPDQTPADLVVGGSRDFGTSLLADLAVGVQNGKPVIGIAQIQQKNGLMLLAKKTSGIQTPADFAGKKVGVWLGSWQAQFDALMVKQGLAPEDYQLVSQGYSMNGFMNDELDVASAMIYNEYYSVLENGYSRSELNIIDYADYGLDFPGDTLFTSRKMVEEQPRLVAAMVRASLRGWEYAVQHPEEAADIVLKHDQTGMQTRSHQLSMMIEIAKLVQVEGRQLGRSDDAVLQRTIDTLAQFGVLTSAPAAFDVMTNDFWDQAQTP